MRLRGTPVFPRNMVLGCIRDNRLLYEYGREVARQCQGYRMPDSGVPSSSRGLLQEYRFL